MSDQRTHQHRPGMPAAPRRRRQRSDGRRAAARTASARSAGPSRRAGACASASCGCSLLLVGLGMLAAVSTVFGMMMAVASDLPKLELKTARNSVIVDKDGHKLGYLTGNQKRLFLREDRDRAGDEARDHRDRGPPLLHQRGRRPARHRPRALPGRRAEEGRPGRLDDHPAVRQERARRPGRADAVPEAPRGRARLPPHAQVVEGEDPQQLPEHDLLRQRRLRDRGGRAHVLPAQPPGLRRARRPAAAPSELLPHEAALLAGMVVVARAATTRSRIPRRRARAATSCSSACSSSASSRARSTTTRERKPMPDQGDLQPPVEDTRVPLLHVVDQAAGRRPPRRRPGGRAAGVRGRPARSTPRSTASSSRPPRRRSTTGCRIATARARRSWRSRTRPARCARWSAATSYNERPFNLATQGQRQPGSAIKPFILAEALQAGHLRRTRCGPRRSSTIDVPHSKEVFTVNNYEGAYSGSTTLARAITFSDNSVFAQVGIKVGTRKVARLAERMGIRTHVSHNYAMTLGGLKEGVTPLDMAHAYETFASGGDLDLRHAQPGRRQRSPRHGARPGRDRADHAPRGRQARADRAPERRAGGQPRAQAQRARARPSPSRSARCCRASSASAPARTHRSPTPSIAGKTGTTEGYGDAWFVGWTPKYTVAVWVGYPNEFKSMETEYQGQPVAGGTFPAAIFQSFISADLRNNPPKEPKPAETPAAPVAGRDRRADGGAAARRHRRQRRRRRRPGAGADRRPRCRPLRRRRRRARRRRRRRAGAAPP